jgi:hypothetical protein
MKNKHPPNVRCAAFSPPLPSALRPPGQPTRAVPSCLGHRLEALRRHRASTGSAATIRSRGRARTSGDYPSWSRGIQVSDFRDTLGGHPESSPSVLAVAQALRPTESVSILSRHKSGTNLFGPLQRCSECTESKTYQRLFAGGKSEGEKSETQRNLYFFGVGFPAHYFHRGAGDCIRTASFKHDPRRPPLDTTFASLAEIRLTGSGCREQRWYRTSVLLASPPPLSEILLSRFCDP